MNRCSKLKLWVTEVVLMNVTRWIPAAEPTCTWKESHGCSPVPTAEDSALGRCHSAHVEQNAQPPTPGFRLNRSRPCRLGCRNFSLLGTASTSGLGPLYPRNRVAPDGRIHPIAPIPGLI